MSDSIAYLLEAKLKPGVRQELDVLLKECVEATEQDASAMNYEFFIDGDDFRAFERFADSPATLGHLGWFGENVAGRFTALVDITGLSVFGTPTDELRAGLDTMGARYFEPCGGFRR